MRLQVGEFIRRFLLHVLPKGLMRVRHYGFLANACRRRKLQTIRATLATPQAVPEMTAQEAIPSHSEGYLCPKCQQGVLRPIAELAPLQWEGG